MTLVNCRKINLFREISTDFWQRGAVALLVLAGLHCGPDSRTPDPTGLAEIRHVVVFQQENRSFDHYFGSLRGVRGFADGAGAALAGGQSVLQQPSGNGFVLPFHGERMDIMDLPHDWTSGHAIWDGNAWDRWVPVAGPETMLYYDRSDLAYYYALADAYTICDGYHCSALGPTTPNRLFLFSGTMAAPAGSGAAGDGGQGSGYTWTTYPERLQQAGISWKVYQEADNFGDNALAWFASFQRAAPGNPLYDRGMAMVPDLVAAFAADVASGQLPKVSWIIAPSHQSEHPSTSSPAAGQAYTGRLLQALQADPETARSTVFILTYDENGGLFDHVPAPVAPAGTLDEEVGGAPIGLGPRVPALIISPWTRGGWVCSATFDHTSILRFLEAWTGVAEPNISQWRRRNCGDLTAAFDFAHPDFSLPALPVPPAWTEGDHLAQTPPAVQAFPAQEPGQRPSRP